MGDRPKRVCFGIQDGDSLQAFGDQLPRQRLGTFQTQQGGIGGFAAGGIGSDRFAKFPGVSLDVEVVVGHLKGQSDFVPVMLQGTHLHVAAPGPQGPAANRGRDQGAGFEAVQLGQPLQRHGAAFGGDIPHLAFDHPPAAGGAGDSGDHGDPRCRGRLAVGAGLGQDLKSKGQQGVSGENGRGFVEGQVAGRLTPAQGIVIHGRQIVVDQGVGVNQFQRAGRFQDRFRFSADGLAGGHAEHRAQAFAAGGERIAHGIDQAPGAAEVLENAGQRGIDLTPARVQIGRQLKHRSAHDPFREKGFRSDCRPNPASAG